MSSTDVQNNFGRVLSHVGRGGTVVIRKRDVPEAVVISFEKYQELTGNRSPVLDMLAAEFDEMLASMQTPDARRAASAAFAADPAELGTAALEAARRKK